MLCLGERGAAEGRRDELTEIERSRVPVSELIETYDLEEFVERARERGPGGRVTMASWIPIWRIAMSSEEDAPATLQAEARRRGVSLSTVLAEAVEEKADAIRRARRQPRTGVGASADGRSAAEASSTPVAHPTA